MNPTTDNMDADGSSGFSSFLTECDPASEAQSAWITGLFWVILAIGLGLYGLLFGLWLT